MRKRWGWIFEIIFGVLLLAMIAFGGAMFNRSIANAKKDNTASQATKVAGRAKLQGVSTATLGDSQTLGWTGKAFAVTPYPQKLSNLLNISVTNMARSGAKTVGTSDSDLPQVVNNNSFKPYQLVTIMIGINDYESNVQLQQVQDSLTTAIQNLRQQNNKLKIIGILPIQSMQVPSNKNATDAMQTKNQAGYTETDLLNAEQQTYQNLKVPFYDWRRQPVVTPTNANNTLGDNLYPTQSTYNQMAFQLANYLVTQY